ncbi:GntR family transcriptional regulator [Pseudoalteromonas umbrosa]|uniref:GntR family transcriptional regulator n=1 Tax=Pseudoalteromonas umbrosa TaxID=3048489 RepID=UPI0024C2C7DA|nr:GntR family transcriptional regulator [Pseudoalteromonas sp. B95]MDK1288701.1 GntR family transcriptional regulator [Pseudoalteromonas sp. B95]
MALAELIERAVEHKQLAYDQRLPAQRVLADLLHITHGTVTRAYDLLEQADMCEQNEEQALMCQRQISAC